MIEKLKALKSNLLFASFIDWESSRNLSNLIHQITLIIESNYEVNPTYPHAKSSIIKSFIDVQKEINDYKFHKDINKRFTNQREAFQKARKEALSTFDRLVSLTEIGNLILKT